MNKEWLYEEYVVKDRSSLDIADEYGCKRNTIQQWLSKHKIKKPIVKCQRPHIKPHETKDFLISEHFDKGKSVSQIAKENGVDYDTIRYHMKKFGIKPRKMYYTKFTKDDTSLMISMYCDMKMSANELAKYFDTSHNIIIKHLNSCGIQTRSYSEAQFNYRNKEINELLNDKEWLEKMHWDEGKSCVDIGRELNVHAKTVRNHMHKLGIPTKNNSQSKLGVMIGENHPNWKGGVTPLVFRLREFFHINQAPEIAKRDHFTCQLCGKTHTSLHVHHIVKFSDIVKENINEHPEYDIQTTYGMNMMYDIITHDKRFLDQDNLITYCRDCHLFVVHGLRKQADETISNQAS